MKKLLLALLVSACSSEVMYLPVQRINFAYNIATQVSVRSSYQLPVWVSPRNASNTTILFESSDPTIAYVDVYGNVLGIRPGIVFLKFTSADNPNVTTGFHFTITN